MLTALLRKRMLRCPPSEQEIQPLHTQHRLKMPKLKRGATSTSTFRRVRGGSVVGVLLYGHFSLLLLLCIKLKLSSFRRNCEPISQQLSDPARRRFDAQWLCCEDMLQSMNLVARAVEGSHAACKDYLEIDKIIDLTREVPFLFLCKHDGQAVVTGVCNS